MGHLQAVEGSRFAWRAGAAVLVELTGPCKLSVQKSFMIDTEWGLCQGSPRADWSILATAIALVLFEHLG